MRGRDTRYKPTDKPNASIKKCNNTFVYLSIIDRQTGPTGSPVQNSHITTKYRLPLVFHPSSSITDDTPTKEPTPVKKPKTRALSNSLKTCLKYGKKPNPHYASPPNK